MPETNGTLERILDRMDRRDARFEKMFQEQRKINQQLAGISKELTLMLNRHDDRLARLEK